AVAGARIRADCAAVLEITQDRKRVLDDLVRALAFDIGNEADSAGILVERRIVKTLRTARFVRRRVGSDAFVLEEGRAHGLALTRRRADHNRLAGASTKSATFRPATSRPPSRPQRRPAPRPEMSNRRSLS